MTPPTSQAGSPSSSPDGRSGMTLVELMVVLVVMAVLAGAVLPAIASATRREGSDRAARQITDLLHYAAAAAVGRGRPVTVSLDPEQGKCWVATRTVSLPWLETQGEAPAERVLTALRLPEGVQVFAVREDTAGSELPASAGLPSVRFGPDGTAQEVTLEVTDQTGALRVVEIRAVTGEIRLLEEAE